ncbi:MAG: ABC transporter ATP-binding protein [Thermodesulfobacteriota bacterium]|nr:ABC transporter ATP-binding protein [Thermodesulfobacteriota bacterium]
MNDALPLLEAKNIFKVFQKGGKRVEVLKGVNLKIDSGSMIAIVGPSGVGKSTLLYILGTLEKPSVGNILYHGENLYEKSPDELAKLRNNKLGFVFQFHYLLTEFNAIENIMIPALICGWDKKKAREASMEILIKVGLQDRMQHKPGELSGGEQQRVAVARSLIMNPEILLADEPTGNLDSKTGNELQELLFEFNKEMNTTIIIVTHNETLAGRLNKIIHIQDGKIVN